MKTYRFSCAVRIEAPGTPWDGHLYPVPGLITPAVTANTPTEAIQHPDTVAFCDFHVNKVVVYRMVR